MRLSVLAVGGSTNFALGLEILFSAGNRALAAAEYIRGLGETAVLLSDHPSTVNKYSLACRVPPLVFHNFMYLWGLVSLTS